MSRVALFHAGEPLWGLPRGKLVGRSHGLLCGLCWDRSSGQRQRQPTSKKRGWEGECGPSPAGPAAFLIWWQVGAWARLLGSVTLWP